MSKQKDTSHVQVIGRVIPNPRGTWDNETTYEKMDFVIFRGNGYVCKQENTGKLPEIYGSCWVLVVEKGEKGDKGDRGEIGVNAPVFIGTWDKNKAYNMYDVVEYNGSSYICMQDSVVGLKPSDEAVAVEVDAAAEEDGSESEIEPKVVWRTVCKGVAYKIQKNGEISFYNDEVVTGIKTYTTNVYIKTTDPKTLVTTESTLQKKIDQMQSQIDNLIKVLKKYDLYEIIK